MAKVDIFMPFYVGDYLKDTNRLSAAEHGAYLMLMLDYWQNGPIPDDERILFRLSRMSASEWAESKDVLLGYFKHRDGKLIHSRIDRELKAAIERKEHFSERGKKGNDARWGSLRDPSRNPSRTKEGIPLLSPSPSPSPTSSCLGVNTPQDQEAGDLVLKSKNSNILHKPEMAVKAKLTGYEDFIRYDVTSIACAITGEKTGPGIGFFSKQLKLMASKLGDDPACGAFREMLFKYWSEIKSGEQPDSVGAGLTTRVKQIMEKHGGVAK